MGRQQMRVIGEGMKVTHCRRRENERFIAFIEPICCGTQDLKYSLNLNLDWAVATQ